MNKETLEVLNKLSKKELIKLFDLADIGLNNKLDKNELILVLSTEPEFKIKKAIKRLNK